jgi:uncharacterized glyoxalase superfamily protein PhnB
VQRVTPYLLYEDGAAALDWLVRAFAFREVRRTTGGAGGMHAELDLGDGTLVYLGQPTNPEFRNPRECGRTSSVYVMVEDVDTHHERARTAGAEIVEELADLPIGHRRYGCRDPQGHEWFFAMPIG